MSGVITPGRVFQQDARLQPGPVLLADPGEFEFGFAHAATFSPPLTNVCFHGLFFPGFGAFDGCHDGV